MTAEYFAETQILLTNDSGVITSHGYPIGVKPTGDDEVEHSWTVYITSGDQILITFDDFWFPRSDDGECANYLKVNKDVKF